MGKSDRISPFSYWPLVFWSFIFLLLWTAHHISCQWYVNGGYIVGVIVLGSEDNFRVIQDCMVVGKRRLTSGWFHYCFYVLHRHYPCLPSPVSGRLLPQPLPPPSGLFCLFILLSVISTCILNINALFYLLWLFFPILFLSQILFMFSCFVSFNSWRLSVNLYGRQLICYKKAFTLIPLGIALNFS